MKTIQRLHQQVIESKLFEKLKELEAGKDKMVEVTEAWEDLRNIHCDESSLLLSLGIKHKTNHYCEVMGVDERGRGFAGKGYEYEIHKPQKYTRITTLEDLGFSITCGIADLLGDMEEEVIIHPWDIISHVDCYGEWLKKKKKKDDIKGSFVKTPSHQVLAETWIMGELGIINRNGYEVERSFLLSTRWDRLYQVKPAGIKLKKALTASRYYDKLTESEYCKWRVEEGGAGVRNR